MFKANFTKDEQFLANVLFSAIALSVILNLYDKYKKKQNES